MTDDLRRELGELQRLKLSSRLSQILDFAVKALDRPRMPPSPLRSREDAHEMAEILRQVYGRDAINAARALVEQDGSTFSRAVLQALEWRRRDEERQKVLRDFDILGTPPEASFDDLVHIAAHVCETPVAAITFISGDWQLFKSVYGYSDAPMPVTATLCAKILDDPGLVEFRDLKADPFASSLNFVVGAPHARFYASVPLQVHEGPIVGRLCVVDTVARTQGLSPEQAVILSAVGRQVMVQMTLRKLLHKRQRDAKTS